MRHILTFEGVTPTYNSGYRKHWSHGAAETRTWRQWSRILCARKPPLTRPVIVHVQPHKTDNRLADAGAAFACAKAIIDGAVDAGMIPADGPKHVVELRLYAPVNVGVNQLLVEFEEVDDGT